jgi:hypothetical protein
MVRAPINPARSDRRAPAAFTAAALGVLAMAVFQARGGAFRLNTRFGRANPLPQER